MNHIIDLPENENNSDFFLSFFFLCKQSDLGDVWQTQNRDKILFCLLLSFTHKKYCDGGGGGEGGLHQTIQNGSIINKCFST